MLPNTFSGISGAAPHILWLNFLDTQVTVSYTADNEKQVLINYQFPILPTTKSKFLSIQSIYQFPILPTTKSKFLSINININSIQLSININSIQLSINYQFNQ